MLRGSFGIGKQVDYKIANIGINFRLTNEKVDHQKLIENMETYPEIVEGILLDRTFHPRHGEPQNESPGGSIFPNQSTLYIHDVNASMKIRRIKIFNTGTCQVSRITAFEMIDNLVEAIRHVVGSRFNLVDLDEINIKIASINLTFYPPIFKTDTHINLAELYDAYVDAGFLFYNLTYNVEATNAIRVYINSKSFKIFPSGCITYLGSGIRNKGEADELLNIFFSTCGSFFNLTEEDV